MDKAKKQSSKSRSPAPVGDQKAGKGAKAVKGVKAENPQDRKSRSLASDSKSPLKAQQQKAKSPAKGKKQPEVTKSREKGTKKVVSTMKSEKSPEKSRIETLGKQAAELKEKAGKQADKAEKTGKAAKKEEELKKSSKKEDDGSLKPTRGVSAYLFFNSETVERLKKEEGLSHREALAKSGQLWKELSEDDRAPW